MGHVRETACRKVDLSSCYLQDGSKPGLNRASRSLRRQGVHIYNMYLYGIFDRLANLWPAVLHLETSMEAVWNSKNNRLYARRYEPLINMF